jgi:hypothetical protein
MSTITVRISTWVIFSLRKCVLIESIWRLERKCAVTFIRHFVFGYRDGIAAPSKEEAICQVGLAGS